MADAILEWMMDRVMPWLLIIMMPVAILLGLFLLIAAPIALYQSVTAETFTLRKDQWACGAEERRLVIVGKTPVNRKVCVLWERIAPLDKSG